MYKKLLFLLLNLVIVFQSCSQERPVNNGLFLNIKRNNTLFKENPKLAQGILEIKVYGAKKGKYYRLEWLGNGTKTWGPPNYEILFSEYDQKQYGTASEASRSDLVKLGDLKRTRLEKKQTVRRLISLPNSSISFAITYRPSVFGDFEGLNFPHQNGYGMVINPRQYIYDIAAFEIEEQNFNPQVVIKKGTQVSVRHKYDLNNDLQLDFDHTGANALYSLKEVRLVANDSLQVSRGLTKPSVLISPSISDWIGPYIVRANNNQLVQSSPAFTGGNHDMDFRGVKVKTGKTMEVKIWTDRGNIKEGEVTSCRALYIKVSNLIQGYNTVTATENRAVLKEEYLFTVYNGKVDVSLNITPLEEITIETYYGLQTVNSIWNESIHYINGEQGKRVSIQGISNNSGPKGKYPLVNKYLLKDRDGYHALVAWVDPTYGLGKFQYLADNQPQAFTESYGKAYFNLINGKHAILKENKPLHWRGGWIFTNTSATKKPADLIYAYSDPVKGLHYINLDLNQPGELFLLMSPGHKNKSYKVIPPDPGVLEVFPAKLKINAKENKSIRIAY